MKAHYDALMHLCNLVADYFVVLRDLSIGFDRFFKPVWDLIDLNADLF